MFFSSFGTDDESELPGSTDWFKLDGDVGLGRANKRADLVKVESLLANSGDLDLSEIGGPTGYGLYTVEDGVKKYQARNGLDVDGWMKPGGPTITKMKEQLGGLLSGYPAPTPEQVDQHHRLRAEGKDGLLNVDLPPISLKGNPYLPPVDKSTHGSNESWVNWMTRHQKGLGGAPDMLATYIKNFGTDGVVQARDFVEQWDKALPGEGATAIRAILSLVSDPAQQRAFLGGDLPKGTPFGVLKPDAAAGVADPNAPAQTADEPPEHDWVIEPGTGMAYIRSSQPGVNAEKEGLLRRPGDKSKPVPLVYNMDDEKPRWEYDQETGERIWVDPKQPRPPRLPKPGDDGPRWVFDRITGERYWFNPIQLMSLDNAGTQTADDATGNDGSEINHGLLAPYLGRDERQVEPGVQVAQNAPIDAEPGEPSPDIQEARVREPSNSDKVNAYFDRYDALIQGMAERLGTKPEFLHAVFSHEGGWGAGDGPVKHNNPSGTMDGNKIKDFNSIEDALQHWERTFGERIKGTQTIEDFVDKLQKNGKTGNDYYNWVNSRDNSKRSNTGKSYEDLIMDQDRTIRNRREIWQRNRQRPG